MLNSPLVLPQSELKNDDAPSDMLGWLKKALLGGQGLDNLDPTMSSLLTGLLGSELTGMGNGKSS